MSDSTCEYESAEKLLSNEFLALGEEIEQNAASTLDAPIELAKNCAEISPISYQNSINTTPCKKDTSALAIMPNSPLLSTQSPGLVFIIDERLRTSKVKKNLSLFN